MSDRPQLSPSIVLAAGDMGGNLITAPTIIQKLSMVSYGLSWSGSSPVGTVSVQLSNDFSLNAVGAVNNAGTWNTMTLFVNGAPVTTIPVSGNTGSGFIDIDQCAAYACRLIYTSGSGNGTLVVTINGKVS